jgi:hypothetical protein
LEKEKRQKYKIIAVVPIEPSPLFVVGRTAQLLPMYYGGLVGLVAGILIATVKSASSDVPDPLSSERLALRPYADMPSSLKPCWSDARSNRSRLIEINEVPDRRPLT